MKEDECNEDVKERIEEKCKEFVQLFEVNSEKLTKGVRQLIGLICAENACNAGYRYQSIFRCVQVQKGTKGCPEVLHGERISDLEQLPHLVIIVKEKKTIQRVAIRVPGDEDIVADYCLNGDLSRALFLLITIYAALQIDLGTIENNFVELLQILILEKDQIPKHRALSYFALCSFLDIEYDGYSEFIKRFGEKKFLGNETKQVEEIKYKWGL